MRPRKTANGKKGLKIGALLSVLHGDTFECGVNSISVSIIHQKTILRVTQRWCYYAALFLFPFHRSNCFLLFLDEIESYNNGVIRFAQNVCVAGIEIFNSSLFFPGRRRRRGREGISIESAFETRNKKSGTEWNSFDELKCERELKS